MVSFRPLPCASALALLLSATGALADVSAADVWNHWKTAAEASGVTLTAGSESATGGTLTLGDVSISRSDPAGAVNATLESLTFHENGDGTVTIAMSAEYPVTMDLTDDDETLHIEMTATQAGLEMTASGTPDAVSYAYKVGSLGLALDDLSGSDVPEDLELAASLTLADVTGSYVPGAADPLETVAGFKAASLAVNVDGSSESENASGNFSLTSEDFAGDAATVMREAFATGDMAKALAEGFSMNGTLAFGPTNTTGAMSEHGDESRFASKLAAGGFTFGLSADGLEYRTDARELELTVAGADLPMPELVIRLAEMALGVTIPVSQRDTPQDMSALVRVVGLDLPADLWAMADPTGILPHDPATLIVDLAASGKWLVDIFAGNAGMDLETAPADLQSVTLRELKVIAAGAEANADGSFALDSSAPGITPDVPAAEGTLNIRLSGVNGLLDKLSGVFVPADEIAMAKMMLGMFTVPGEGADTATSKIEITKSGQISANGVPLPM